MAHDPEAILNPTTSPSTTESCLPPLTKHAATRMQQRGIRLGDVEAAISYGRTIRAKGAVFFVIGHKEVQKYSTQGIDLKSAAGIQVLVSHDGTVLTTYRSHDLHAIRSTPRRRSNRAMSHH